MSNISNLIDTKITQDDDIIKVTCSLLLAVQQSCPSSRLELLQYEEEIARRIINQAVYGKYIDNLVDLKMMMAHGKIRDTVTALDELIADMSDITKKEK